MLTVLRALRPAATHLAGACIARSTRLRVLALAGTAALVAGCSTPLPYPAPPMTFSLNLSRPLEVPQSAAYETGMTLGREHAGVKACAPKLSVWHIERHRRAIELVLSVQPEPDRADMLRGFAAADRSPRRTLLGGDYLDCAKAEAFVAEREACLTAEAVETRQRQSGYR